MASLRYEFSCEFQDLNILHGNLLSINMSVPPFNKMEVIYTTLYYCRIYFIFPRDLRLCFWSNKISIDIPLK